MGPTEVDSPQTAEVDKVLVAKDGAASGLVPRAATSWQTCKGQKETLEEPSTLPPFLTFVRPCPRRAPPGVADDARGASPQALHRWSLHSYRYPLDQYEDLNGVWQQGCWRPLVAPEREVRLGFPKGHTLPAVSKRHKTSTPKTLEGLLTPQGFGPKRDWRDDDVRCALLGKAVSVPIVAWLFGQLLSQIGYLPSPPTVAECWGGESTEAKIRAQLILGARANTPSDSITTLGELCLRNASYRGSDVRMTTGTLYNPNCWPRRPIEANLFQWRVVISYHQSGAHINVLELQAALAATKWRLRRPQNIRTRWVHLLDSQVCLAVVVKGRSSSRQLGAVLRRLNALVLAGSGQGLYAYVSTHDNPANAPSRWGSAKQNQA